MWDWGRFGLLGLGLAYVTPGLGLGYPKPDPDAQGDQSQTKAQPLASLLPRVRVFPGFWGTIDDMTYC